MTDKVNRRLSFIINVAYVAVLIGLVYIALKYVLGWVMPFIVAFIIVSLINPIIRLIRRQLKINHKAVSLLVMVLVYALLAVILFLIIMQLVVLVRDALTELPAYFEQRMMPALTGAFDSVMTFIRQLPPEWQERITNVQGDIIRTLQTFLVNLSEKGISLLTSLTASIPSFLIAFVFTIMLSFFISMQYDAVLDFFRLQCSPKVMEVVRDLRGIGIDTVVKYFRAALTLMFITFVELSIGLVAIRTPSAIPIAAGIAVFDALPFVGTGAIMIPWCLIELLQGNLTYAFGLGILYAIVTVVRNIIEPKIVGDKLGLNPIVSLTAIYVGFKLLGVLGMIIMPILTQIVMELHRQGTIRLYRERSKESQDVTITFEEEPEP